MATQFAHFWLLDVRYIWSGAKIDDAAPEALRLVNTIEITKARGFHFLKDAKLSVGSSLLKRLFAATAASPRTRWADARFGRRGDKKHGKPCLLLPRPNTSTRQQTGPQSRGQQAETDSETGEDYEDQLDSDFNVSHQAGLVALAGYSTSPGSFEQGSGRDIDDRAQRTRVTSIGIDIVCVNERNDARQLARHGFEGWVDMHAEIFSDADLEAMKAPAWAASGDGKGQSEDGDAAIQIKVRRFYAYWALKEAYVKMEGEALLAGWLRDVEFRRVSVPDAGSNVASNSRGDESAPVWGGTTKGIEVYFMGRRRMEVDLFLQAFEENYMIATAVVKEDPMQAIEAPSWRLLDLEKDVYPFAD